jgi:hypothetical protein
MDFGLLECGCRNEGELKMTNIQKAREIMNNVRWQEAREGRVCHETRKQALGVLLGLLNRHGDKRLVSACFRAMNFNRMALGG